MTIVRTKKTEIYERCGMCRGSGFHDKAKQEKCFHCYGEGVMILSRKIEVIAEEEKGGE